MNNKAVRFNNNSQGVIENNYEQNPNRLLKNMFKIQQSHDSTNTFNNTQQSSTDRMNESGNNFNIVMDE